VRAAAVDMAVRVGSVDIANPVMTASGTAGHGDELSGYVDLAALGAVVVKSLGAGAEEGNPPLRVCDTAAGMLNSVGLAGPGVEAWLERDLPPLVRAGARVVASIWGRRVEDFGKAAAMLAGASDSIMAVEVNVSCPNIEDRDRMFAHSRSATADAVAASGASGLPLWAKLSPNTADLCEVAAAAHRAGAEAVTLVNTVLGMAIDVETRRPRLGGAGGGLSGPAIHPVAVRAVYDCRQALPGVALVGVGGVSRGVDAVELMMAGASAVQVGTATFADPRAPARVLDELTNWCRHHGVGRVSELIGAAHG
jgi:dihydroorotate dehydrogenase (NAD+) catalytic subunit